MAVSYMHEKGGFTFSQNEVSRIVREESFVVEIVPYSKETGLTYSEEMGLCIVKRRVWCWISVKFIFEFHDRGFDMVEKNPVLTVSITLSFHSKSMHSNYNEG